ncbi:MAG: T9SS type A sorting domain-containing protein [Candidatus Cloacimonetes bacterium]|nr:T9SS type A sorting domain-containing protein [Candidatus Cloacimonadota bacterium]
MKKTILLVLMSMMLCFAFATATNTAPNSLNTAFTISQRNAMSMNVRFDLPQYSIVEEHKGATNYQRIVIPQAGSLMQAGMPELPTLSTSIAIPAHGSVNIEVLSSQQDVRSGFLPYPVQQGNNLDEPKGFVIDNEYYNSGSLYPVAALEYSDPMILRDFRIVTVQINPFSYNPQTGELIIHETIDFRVNYTAQAGINELASEPGTISASFAGMYESFILNYDDYRDAVVANTPPRYLIIYGNNSDPAYLNAVNEYAFWKRQKGADVMMASTASGEAGSSTTTIKAYIQAKYNDPATRPDFVILIGDVSGSYTIPAFTVSSGGGDYPYTHLDGTDLLGECFIGRISVENLSQLTVVLNKIYLYEKNINPDTAEWLDRMLLVGDTAPSGQSTIYMAKYIKEMSLLVNPNYTYTELYNDSPAPSAMNSAINQGVGFFSYRGYINMSNWSPSESLVNGFKLPHAIIITCSTGNYATGTGTTEAFIRLGTTASPKGAVTAIGMSTSSTHTTFNNVLHGGIFGGLFQSQLRTMGEALLHGKLYMSQTFGVSSPTNVQKFTHWCNLMGDPTMEVFTGHPNLFTPQMATTFPLGLGMFDVAVADTAGLPVEGAAITLSMGTTIVARGYTDASGNCILLLPSTLTAGDAVLTISKHEFKPYQGTITINNQPTLAPGAIVIDDDSTLPSSGNGNGIAEAGEIVEVLLSLTNTGTNAVSGISGSISCDNPYVTLTDSTVVYPEIAGGASAANNTSVVVQISQNIPHQSMLRLNLVLTDAAQQAYNVSAHFEVTAPKPEFVSYLVIDTNNQHLDPGESTELSITVRNNSAMPVLGVMGRLYTQNDLVGVPDYTAEFGNLDPGVSVTCGTDRFGLQARPEVLPGMLIPMRLKLYTAGGWEQFIDFTLSVGQVASTTPLGPDAYGYVIYDWTDTAYPEAPVYAWIPIAPAEGGLGTQLAISDAYTSSDEGDQTGADPLETVSLPFPFQFYGQIYDQVTVASNGFVTFGPSMNGEFRNYRLPGPMGPSPMIAAFWDDLATITGGGIYTYFDRGLHAFIIEWYNIRNGGTNGTAVESFQIVLYDQAAYPTSLGDGPIKIQYHTFNNVDAQSGNEHGNFCTIGIEDHTGTVGLEYSFNNLYPTAAAPLSNNKAIYITNIPIYHEAAHLIIDDTYVDDANHNGVCEPGETVEFGVAISNGGNLVAQNVNATVTSTSEYVNILNGTSTYYPISPDQTAVNQIPFSFQIDADCPDGEVLGFNINLVSGEIVFDRQFSFQVSASTLAYKSYMVDDHEANFDGVIDTGESFNLVINLQNNSVVDARDIQATLASTDPNLQILNPVLVLDKIAPNDIIQLIYPLSCANVPASVTDLVLNFSATCSNGNPTSVTFDVPYNNPDYYLDFEFDDGDFDSETGWVWGTPAQVTPPSGQKLWATNLSGQYPSLVQYHLYSPIYTLGSASTLTFRHYYAFENGHDGANVAISTNNGQSWNIIHPNSPYNGTSLSGLGGETGWTGNSGGWQNPSFNLSSYAGQTVMFRYRFGSDGATTNTGWFIDNFDLAGVVKKTGYLHGVVYSSSGSNPANARVVSNQHYATNPDAEGNFRLFLPNGTHTVTASMAHHQASSVNAVPINPTTPTFYTEFTLIDLPQPLNLHATVDNDTGEMSITWNEPQDPVLPVTGYHVYRKFDSGPYEMVLNTSTPLYEETLTLLGIYQYYVRVNYLNVEGTPSDTLIVPFPYTSNPEEPTPGLVNNLNNNYPNPFNPTTTISFSLAKAGKTTLAIYNLKGQLVTNLVNGEMNEGQHHIVWNGRDAHNRGVASGMYFYSLQSGDFRAVKKMLLMK